MDATSTPGPTGPPADPRASAIRQQLLGVRDTARVARKRAEVSNAAAAKLGQDLAEARRELSAARAELHKTKGDLARAKVAWESAQRELDQLKSSPMDTKSLPMLGGVVGPPAPPPSPPQPPPSANGAGHAPTNGTTPHQPAPHGEEHPAQLESTPTRLTRRFEVPPEMVSKKEHEKALATATSRAKAMEIQANEALGDLVQVQYLYRLSREANDRLRSEDERKDKVIAGLMAKVFLFQRSRWILLCAMLVLVLAGFMHMRHEAPTTGLYRITGVTYDHSRQLLVGTATPDPTGSPLPTAKDVQFVWTCLPAVTRPTLTKYEREGSTLVLYLTVPLAHSVSRDRYVTEVDLGQ